MEDLFKGLGVQIDLEIPDNFLKIKETLTRIGIASKKEKKLYQSCHILHKQGKYSILHFKELFILDGKENNLSEEDIERRTAIANLLEEWKLCKILFQEDKKKTTNLNQIKIISHKEKDDWILESKYSVGKK
jgi:hypothetical protein